MLEIYESELLIPINGGVKVQTYVSYRIITRISSMAF